MLQEAEAASRGAKVAWCTRQGGAVTNLQHDGVFVDGAIGDLAPADIGEGMSVAASAAVGYPVTVKPPVMLTVD